MTDRQREWQIAFLKQARIEWDAYKKARLLRLLPLAYEIESLAPALAQDGPNPEYPWLDKLDRIQAPGEYVFPLIKSLQTSHGVTLLKHIENCIAEFEKIFLS